MVAREQQHIDNNTNQITPSLIKPEPAMEQNPTSYKAHSSNLGRAEATIPSQVWNITPGAELAAGHRCEPSLW